MSFNNIIGNNKTKGILIKSLKNKTILHSYMFVGNEGIGKKLIAKEFAKMVLCENFDDINNQECDNCKSCIEFLGNNNPDFIMIEPDGKNIKIVPKMYVDNEVLNYLFIFFDNFVVGARANTLRI